MRIFSSDKMCNVVFFCGKLNFIKICTWNSDECKCEFPKCNGKSNEDTFIVLVKDSSSILRARQYIINVINEKGRKYFLAVF